MNAVEKKRLSLEVKMQLKALKKIRLWRTIAIAISTIGAALTYAAFAGDSQRIFLGILGIILIFISIGCAVIFNLGLKNGERNVEKILKVLESCAHEI